jgi:hypothetical protein
MNLETINSSISLYGAEGFGFGYIIEIRDQDPIGNNKIMAGDGELRFTTLDYAIESAVENIRFFGIKDGVAYVHEPEGRFVAKLDIAAPAKFEDLAFKVAPVYTISADEIIAAGEEPAGQ